MRAIRVQAFNPAHNAASAIAKTDFYMYGQHERPANDHEGRDLLQFILDNPLAPVDSIWIRGGALGFHDGTRRFDELDKDFQLAIGVFQRVFLQVSEALEEAEARDKAEAELAARIEAEAKAREGKDPLEGTILERERGPLEPSDLALGIAEKQAAEAAAGLTMILSGGEGKSDPSDMVVMMGGEPPDADNPADVTGEGAAADPLAGVQVFVDEAAGAEISTNAEEPGRLANVTGSEAAEDRGNFGVSPALAMLDEVAADNADTAKKLKKAATKA